MFLNFVEVIYYVQQVDFVTFEVYEFKLFHLYFYTQTFSKTMCDFFRKLGTQMWPLTDVPKKLNANLINIGMLK